MNKNNEIVSENIFHLLINIVGNNDKFFFTFQRIEITMYQCNMPLCIIIMNLMIDMYCKQGWEF